VPRCSIVIAAYNVERYVAEAIRSALGQTYGDREVIVVDDGSEDGTASRIAEFGDRIVFIEQAHRGAAAARNRGIQAARGEFIALLDADDIWAPGRIEEHVAFLDDHPEFGLVTPSLIVGRSRFHAEDQAFWIGQTNFVSYSALVRREAYERHGTFDEALTAAMDWELWIRLVAGGERIGAVPPGGTGGLYRRRPSSITADRRRYLVARSEMLDRVLAKGVRLPGLDATADVARGLASLVDGDASTARRHFAGALRNRSAWRGTRLRALPFVLSPRTAWWIYNGLTARRRRRAEERSQRRAAQLGVEP